MKDLRTLVVTRTAGGQDQAVAPSGRIVASTDGDGAWRSVPDGRRTDLATLQADHLAYVTGVATRVRAARGLLAELAVPRYSPLPTSVGTELGMVSRLLDGLVAKLTAVPAATLGDPGLVADRA